MFESFENVFRGHSPIRGKIDGLWGYKDGHWLLLNSDTAAPREGLNPCDIVDVCLINTFGRNCTEMYAMDLLRFAQGPDAWMGFTSNDVNVPADQLDLLVECGWLTHTESRYRFTNGFVVFMHSRSGCDQPVAV